MAARRFLWPRIVAAGGQHNPHRISIGFPRGSRLSIGQCWNHTHSADGVHEIFISPTLKPAHALDVLLHELVHASVGTKAKHGATFKKVALAVGLTGQMTATLPGKALRADIKRWLRELPKFPGAPMHERRNEKKQTTRLLKCMCAECGYTVRTTARWLEVGAPHCPEHGAMEVI
jgi:hypothetical protein